MLEVESNVDVIVNNNGVDILNSVMEKYPEDEKIAVQVNIINEIIIFKPNRSIKHYL